MNINFVCAEKDVAEKLPIVPAKKLIPDWYRTLKQDTQLHPGGPTIPTIKQCPPVTDFITSGYIIPNPYELTMNPKSEPGNFESFDWNSDVNYDLSVHHHKMCPVTIKGTKRHWVKIKHPWIVKTPPGYSCLFVQPFFFFNPDLHLFPAIVDTDKHDLPVEFPGYSLHNRTITINKGDPLMQIIPFKRDEWTHNIIVEQLETELKEGQTYKKLFHSKKKFQ